MPEGAAFDISESEEPDQIDIEPSEGDYDKPQQLSLFGDFEIDTPDTSDIVQPTMPTTQVTNDMIDCFLRTGAKERNGLEHIVAEFQKNKSVHERADFLRKEFGTDCNGLNYVSPDGLQQTKIAVTHNNNGITIGIGDRARNDSSVSLSWEQAAERIDELLSKGEYCSQEIIDRAYNNEIKELSQKLWYLHQDVEVEYFIPKHFFNGGFDVSTEKIAEALRDETFVRQFTDGMRDLITQYEQNRDVLRFHHLNLTDILHSLEDLQLPLAEYKAIDGFFYTPDLFITQDEKDAVLCNEPFTTKMHIAEYFSQPHTDKEKADYLKDTFGTSGGTIRGGFVSRDFKGYEIDKGDYGKTADKVKMSWYEVSKRVQQLIGEGKYISEVEAEKANNVVNSDIIRSSDEKISEEMTAEVKADKIHNSFDAVIDIHNFSEETIKFLRRTEKFMNVNGYSEVDTNIFNAPIFQQNYGSISRINDKLFDGKFNDVIEELNRAIKINIGYSRDELKAVHEEMEKEREFAANLLR